MISGLMSSRVFTLGSVTAQRKNLLVEAHVRLLMYYTDLYPDAYALSPEHARAPYRSGASPSVLRTTGGAAVSRGAAAGGGAGGGVTSMNFVKLTRERRECESHVPPASRCSREFGTWCGREVGEDGREARRVWVGVKQLRLLRSEVSGSEPSLKE